MYAFLCEWITHILWMSLGAEEGIEFPGATVTGGYNLPDLVLGTKLGFFKRTTNTLNF